MQNHIMKTNHCLLAAVSLLSLLGCPTLAQTFTKTENFDIEENARTNGWVELGSRANNMDYGYSAGTSFAAGLGPGEAGGKVGCDQSRSMYADVFGSLLTLEVPMTATGRLAIAFQNGNASVILGHSDSKLVGQNQDSRFVLGLRTVPSALQLEAVIGLTNAVRTAIVLNGGLDVTGLTNYIWQYAWDPNGGTSSNGALTVIVSDSFGGVSSFTNSVTLSLSAADRSQNPTFDSFGLTTRTLSASDVFAQTYVDDVAYTALPSCVSLRPGRALVVPGQTNKAVSVVIPVAANLLEDVHVTVASLSPTIAKPLGAVAGTLTLTFPAGGPNTQTFYIQGVSAGDTDFQFSSTNGLCFASDEVAVTVATAATTLVKTETFNTADSARTNGWSEIGSRENGQDFGFAASANAGGPAGEAGGFFKRDPIRVAYADIFTGQMSLNDRLQASGTIVVMDDTGANAGPIIGQVDSSKIGQNSEANQIGLECVVASGTSRYYARLTLANSTGYEVAVLNPAVTGQVYNWEYLYDPTGGPSGDGALTVNVTDGISGFTNTTVINLSAADRQVGARFDSFGMYSRALSANPAGSPVFLDNVTYTALPSGACVRFVGDTSLVNVVGQTNKLVTVTIPAAANGGASFSVTVQSLNPTVARPSGANGSGALVLTFPAGGGVSQSFFCESLSPGQTTFTLSHGGPFCTGGTVDVTVHPTAATRLKTESFETAAAAATNGWVELGSRSNGQDFGFSATTFAGGPAGEAGGVFKRDSIRSCYVDVYGGKLTLNDHFSASGRIIIPDVHSGNLGPNIGHTDSTRSGMNSASLPAGPPYPAEANNIALNIVSGTTFVPELILADGSRRGETAFLTGLSTSTVYDWYYVYDPTGGPSGNGSLTCAVISEGVTNVGVYLLTAEDRAIGAEFDSFGLTSRALSSSSATGPLYMDDVTYSVPVNPLRIADIQVVGNNVRLIIDTPSIASSHVVRETAALGTAFTPVTEVNWSVTGNQVVAEFPKPGSTRFYQVTIP